MTYKQLSNLKIGDKVKDSTNGLIGEVFAFVCGVSLDDSEIHCRSSCGGEMSMFADELQVIK